VRVCIPVPRNLDQLMENLVLDQVSGRSLVERHPPHEEGTILIPPLEALLYLFLAFLTHFVYSNIVL